MSQDALLANIRPDEILDTYGLLCPIPIVKVAENVRRLAAGTVLEVIATDGGIEVDLANWCKSRKHKYLGCRQEGRVYHVFLQVGELSK
jgi:tRNA 2-thiouridine synthesizing protein A